MYIIVRIAFWKIFEQPKMSSGGLPPARELDFHFFADREKESKRDHFGTLFDLIFDLWTEQIDF